MHSTICKALNAGAHNVRLGVKGWRMFHIFVKILESGLGVTFPNFNLDKII